MATWKQQLQLVNSLSDQAWDNKQDARRIRADLKAWVSCYLGSPEALAWIFVAGSWWAAGRSGTSEKGDKRRSAMAAINTSLMAWQLFSRDFKLPPSTADKPAEAKP